VVTEDECLRFLQRNGLFETDGHFSTVEGLYRLHSVQCDGSPHCGAAGVKTKTITGPSS
jgi:hypothetical protein